MRISSLILIVFFPLMGFSQTSTLKGSVTDNTGEPLIYVNIHLPELKKGVYSDVDGNYHIDKIPFGTHRVMITHLGFRDLDTTILFNQPEVSLSLRLKSDNAILTPVDISDKKEASIIQLRLKDVEGFGIYAAKKSEVIDLRKISANLAANNARQIFARVPGVVAWENDCAGLQLGVGARGLSPDRTANFNTRQNGYDMSADALGYPESYYAPPMQAIDRIEIVRGAASLQYGTQFGGLINLKLKKGDPNRKLSGRTVNTYNSIGWFNTYNELGGQKDKVNYYGFLNLRTGECQCDNSQFDAYTGHIRLGYQVTPKFEVVGEFTRMNYLAQQPGGLTDFQFEEDPYQSLRERNWFEVDWNLAAVHLNYDFSNRTKLNSRSFMLLGSRKAVGFLSTPNRLDLEPYVRRDLLVDYYQNFGNETRILHRYDLFNQPSVMVTGFRIYRGHTDKAQGFGSNGTGPDFNFDQEDQNRISDYTFPSWNMALFAENVFNITDRLSITPGLRYEYINTKAEGYYDSSVRVPLTGEVVKDSITLEERDRTRSILLAGIGLGYHISSNMELYANFSQNYRAITFNDMRVVRPSEKVDPNLQDERGFNTDLGIRGSVTKGLTADIGVFWLSYQGRIGSILTTIEDQYFGQRDVRLTTNVGDAEIVGLESYIEAGIFELLGMETDFQLSTFLNLSLIQATYKNSRETSVIGNRVENVPMVNLKTGVQAGWKAIRASFQFTHLSEQYSEATNAEQSSNGTYGIIPAYWVMDFSVDYTYKWLSLEGGVNNISDNAYFTRRATGYPGPGIISSAPRNFYVGLGLKF